MALEHNLIYFSTRAKAARAVSSIHEEKQNVSFPVSAVRSMQDIRKKADTLGLSMPILLRRMQDPDEIYNIIDEDAYAFVNEKASLNKLSDSINKTKEGGAQRGTKTPLIATDYYSVLFSSQTRHIEEIEKMRRFRFRDIFSPKWKRTHQDVWWPAASVHGDVAPWPVPLEIRQAWDELVKVDPDAPMEYRPFYAIKKGTTAGYVTLWDEIDERTKAGYRVIYGLADDSSTPADLRADLEAMQARGGELPWGVGLWNELDFQERLSVSAFKAKIQSVSLPAELTSIHEDFGVMVTPPGLSSFANALKGYGDVIRELFRDVPGFFFKVHSYGYVQPKYWTGIDLKRRMQLAVGHLDCEVIVEETANTFVPEFGTLRDGVIDEQGADYIRAVMYAGMQTGLPTCHFMLYHNNGASNPAKQTRWNNIIDNKFPEYGALRRAEITKVLNIAKATGSKGSSSDLMLDDPRGKEIDIFSYIAGL
jgi:hypothetical protein